MFRILTKSEQLRRGLRHAPLPGPRAQRRKMQLLRQSLELIEQRRVQSQACRTPRWSERSPGNASRPTTQRYSTSWMNELPTARTPTPLQLLLNAALPLNVMVKAISCVQIAPPVVVPPLNVTPWLGK
jgi:hypothetical protein